MYILLKSVFHTKKQGRRVPCAVVTEGTDTEWSLLSVVGDLRVPSRIKIVRDRARMRHEGSSKNPVNRSPEHEPSVSGDVTSLH